jgi:acylphosphatase
VSVILPDSLAAMDISGYDNTLMSQEAKHIIFIGSVQGVGFRFTAFNIANRYQLTGMVRNMPDRSVEMIAQGEPEDISDCIRDIKESFTGYIRDVKIEDAPQDSKLKDFKITF